MEAYFDLHLFDVAGTPITLATLITLVLILLVTIVISKVLEMATVRAFRLRKVTDEGTVGVARRLVHYSVLLIGIGIGLQTVGINLTALFAAGALFAIALGFAMQNIAQNFVSGVILLVERAIKPGDVLKVEGRIVKVTKMGIRATIARTLDDEEIIIPNSVLVQTTVKNLTLKDRLHRLRATVGVLYSSDMAKVMETLQKAAEEISWRVQHLPPRIFLREFGNSSVNFEVSVWIDQPWRMQQRASELNKTIWWALKEAGITIAFPQLDIHLDSPVERSLASLSGAISEQPEESIE
jgi:small-conductance mechanosensitive channel